MAIRGTVLLVDDDADFVALHRETLEDRGYRVVTARNGAECLEQARTEAPDLIVLDVMMAKQTEGINVTYDLRSLPQTRQTPILMVTAVLDALPWLHEPDDFWMLVDAFLEKPVTPERLLHWVDKMLKPRPEGSRHAWRPFPPPWDPCADESAAASRTGGASDGPDSSADPRRG